MNKCPPHEDETYRTYFFSVQHPTPRIEDVRHVLEWMQSNMTDKWCCSIFPNWANRSLRPSIRPNVWYFKQWDDAMLFALRF
jgi:hypothetical protein